MAVTNKPGEFILTLVSVFAFSYGMNYLWESFHSVLLYKDHAIGAKNYVFMVTYASAMDALIILGMYVFVALLWRDGLWLRTFNRKQVGVGFCAGLSAAAFIEYVKVFVMNAWSYASRMPTVAGIGVSPLLQLGVTGILAFWLTRRVLHQRESRPQDECDK